MRLAAATAAALALAAAPAMAEPVGTSFPPGFPVPIDHSLRVPAIGFGAAGPVERVPVIFLHGNNDTPFPTSCNRAFGEIWLMAESFRRRGYATSELWGLGYQGDQCDLQTQPANKSGEAHSTVANVPDLRRFVQAVLTYTGARRVDIVGHSLGGTLAREWMREDAAHGLVRALVAVDSPHHGIINCSPSPANYFQPEAAGGFTPESAICREYGSDRTPLLARLNAGDETPGPTRHVTIYNADRSFVFFSSQDGAFPPVPAEDYEGNPHDFSQSARLAGAKEVPLTGQGRYDAELQTAHLGIIASPETWRAAYMELAPQDAPEPATAAPAPASDEARAAVRLTLTVTRSGRRFSVSGRLRHANPKGSDPIPNGKGSDPIPNGKGSDPDPNGKGSDPVPKCSGTVGVLAKAGRRTVSARLARVRADCTYRLTVAFRRPPRRLRFSGRFFGTRDLAPAVTDSRR